MWFQLHIAKWHIFICIQYKFNNNPILVKISTDMLIIRYVLKKWNHSSLGESKYAVRVCVTICKITSLILFWVRWSADEKEIPGHIPHNLRHKPLFRESYFLPSHAEHSLSKQNLPLSKSQSFFYYSKPNWKKTP